jgi:DNA-binding transcriptional regulator YdaS (Cro superfamily)
MQEVTQDRALEILGDYVRGCGSQKKAAKLIGISESYLSDVLGSRRDPAPVLSRIGIERVVRFCVPKRVGSESR